MSNRQPVRRIIRETQGDKLSESPIYTLLIDGTNLLKICFADTKINTNGEHIGGVFQFLLQMKLLLNKRDWDYVYVFFDDEYSGVLRYEIYSEYKANRGKNYEDVAENISDYMKAYNANLKSMQEAIYGKRKKTYIEKELTDDEKLEKENFARERSILMKYFNELYIRWMMDDKTEGDDLISYYILNKKPNEKIVIVSGDEDMTQLICDDVYIYNPRLKKNITHINFKSEYGYPHTNVLIKKIFCGDTSDNIGNISGLSEKKLIEMIPEFKEKTISIEDVKEKARLINEERVKNKKKPYKYCENILNGVSNRYYDGDFYEINEKLINLKKPLLTDDAKEELESMMHVPQDPDGRSFKNLYQYILDDDITDLKNINVFTSFFRDFKKLEEKEVKNYKKYIEENK